MELEHIIGLTIFFTMAVVLLTCAFVITVKHYGIVQQNEELREYVAFSETRRQRSMSYLLETICKHDRDFIDYQVSKKLGLLPPREPQREPPPLRIQQYAPAPQRHQREMPPPRQAPRQNFRQTEYEPQREPQRELPRQTVIIMPERREPARRLNFNPYFNDDDVIDIEPNEPSPHRAMPQTPLLNAPKRKGGRPRKHVDGAARKRAYDQRQRSA